VKEGKITEVKCNPVQKTHRIPRKKGPILGRWKKEKQRMKKSENLYRGKNTSNGR